MKDVSARGGGAHVLVVDDDVHLCELLVLRLEHHGYRASFETSAARGFARLGHETIDAMILDLRLRDADGLELLSKVQERAPDVPVIVLTAHGTIEVAVDAMSRGAYGFLTKPFEDHQLLQKLAHAVERNALRREVAELRRIVGGTSDETLLVGTSAEITRVREIIARIAPAEATVLILGESGTGKELAARSLHTISPRRRGPFVAVNCGALPPELLESELFGHVKGAFTGATQARTGLFGAAGGGTLFLDEIGEASAAVQVKLLRVLQERWYTPVGSTSEEEADVRIVAASNRDLRAEVAARRFREDLFYRLHVVPLQMPSLRDRVDDIPLLAELFLARAAARHGGSVPRLSGEALDAMRAHDWPGNVRELMHLMEAAVLLAGSDELQSEHLAGLVQPALAAGAPRTIGRGESSPTSGHAVPGAFAPTVVDSQPMPPLREARDAFERAYLVTALRRSGGNVSAAARTAGRNRSDFYDLLRRHGLSPAEFKERASEPRAI